LPDPIVVATLGDSITEGSPEHDSRRGGDEESQWQHWAARRHPDLAFRNFGVYGERTDEIAARLEPSATGADVLVVQGGINDIAQGRDVEAAAGDLRRMVRRGKQLGLRVALANVLPWNNGRAGHAAAIRRLNALIDELGRDEDVPVLRFCETLQDPNNADRMSAEWTHADGDHPSVAGYRRLGEHAFVLPR
jgi:lysophospholipase L1-like esterase